MADDNVAVVKRVYAAMAARDVDTPAMLAALNA
jgi:hypothetical protein